MVNNKNNGDLGFEQKLWSSAEKLKGNVDAAEYKHVVLGLIFLKYISDAFREVYEEIKKDPQGDPEEIDEYKARNVFWVSKEARWNYLQNNAKQPIIGKLIDDAMDELEKDNRSLKGVLPKDYARPALDKQRLGQLIDLIGSIALGDRESRSKDILGRVYEYFLGEFAAAEGKKGGQFYTPRCIVKLLVDMIEPYKGRVLDPCCGSGGMFVQSEKFVQSHSGRLNDISIFGQESNQTTWKLCKMNLAIRGIDSSFIKWNNEGSFLNDEHRDLKADFILANPPFNDDDWNGELVREDIRWKYGVPPIGNANFAWVQHFIHHLAPHGTAGFVLANVSLTSTTNEEEKIRREIINKDLVDCVVVLPDRLFYNTGIPACLWFVTRDKEDHKFRNRKGEILLINARDMGLLSNRKHRELTPQELKKISDTYHSWRGELIDNKKGLYRDEIGFCKSVEINKILDYKAKLLPGLYVGIKPFLKIDKSFNDFCIELIKRSKEENENSLKLKKQLKENFLKYNYSLNELSFESLSNSKIQEIVNNLFHHWFVDFEFPNYENKPYNSNKGKMIESELGKIPEGWKIGTFGEIAKQIIKPVRNKGDYDKYVALEDIPRKQLFLNLCSSTDNVNSSIISFNKGNVLFGSMRPYFHKVCLAPFKGITRTTTFVIEPKEQEYQLFLLLTCFQKSTVDYASATSEGSTIPYAVFENLERMPVIIPKKEIAVKFQNLLSPLLEKSVINTFDNLIIREIEINSAEDTE